MAGAIMALAVLGAGGEAVAGGYNPLVASEAGTAAIVVSPSPVSFGSLQIDKDASAHRRVILRNASGHVLHLAIEKAKAPLVVDASECLSDDGLGADHVCSINIVWTPGQQGKLDTVVVVRSEEGTISIPVSGDATGVVAVNPHSAAGNGLLVAAPDSVDFTQGGAGTEVIEVANTGDQPVHIKKIAAATDEDALTLGGTCLDAVGPDAPTIAPGQACALAITWPGRRPIRTGVIILHDGLRGVVSIAVRGGITGGAGAQIQTADSGTMASRPASPAAEGERVMPPQGFAGSGATPRTATVASPTGSSGTVRLVITGGNVAMIDDGRDVLPHQIGASLELWGGWWRIDSIQSQCVTLSAVAAPTTQTAPISITGGAKKSIQPTTQKQLCFTPTARDGGAQGGALSAIDALDRLIDGAKKQ